MAAAESLAVATASLSAWGAKMAKSVLANTRNAAAVALRGPDWDDFRVFLCVARCGNFNKAAVELAMTQATISRRVERLERSLGVRLFDRSRHGTALTFDGRRVLNEINAAELSLNRATQRSRDATQIEGDCKLLTTDGLAAYWLPRFIPTFADRYAGVVLRCFVTMDPARNARPPFDLQIQYAGGKEADTVALRLGTLHFNFFASRDYIRRFGAPQTFDELARHRLLMFSSNLSDEGNWAEYAVSQAQLTSAHFTNSSAQLAELVRQGMGISFLPTYSVVVDDAFVPVIPDFHRKAALFLNYRRDVVQKPAVRATVDFFKDVVFNRRDMPWFRDDYERPTEDWARTLDRVLGPRALESAA